VVKALSDEAPASVGDADGLAAEEVGRIYCGSATLIRWKGFALIGNNSRRCSGRSPYRRSGRLRQDCRSSRLGSRRYSLRTSSRLRLTLGSPVTLAQFEVHAQYIDHLLAE
jgi:hypothetical protein